MTDTGGLRYGDGPAPFMPPKTRAIVNDGAILALFHGPAKMNTADIARHLHMRESDVANRLAFLRDQEKV